STERKFADKDQETDIKKPAGWRVSVLPGRLHTVVGLEGDTQCVNIVFAGQAVWFTSYRLVIQSSVLLIQLGGTNKQVGQRRIKTPAWVQVIRGTGSQPLTIVIRYPGSTINLFHRRLVKGVTSTQGPVLVQHIFRTERHRDGIAPFFHDMADVVLAQTANSRDNARLGTDNVEVFKARPISPGGTSQQQHTVVQLMGNAQCRRLRASQWHTRGLFRNGS